MNFICGAVSRTPLHPRLKNFRFYRLFLNFKQDEKGSAPLSRSAQLLRWICSGKICFYHVYSNAYVNLFEGGVKAYRLFFFPACVLTHFLDYESLQTSKNIEKCYLMNTALDVYHLDLFDGM